MKAYFEQLIDYNYWANGLILKYTEMLPVEQFTKSTAHSQQSLREILTHVLFAEWLLRERMEGRSYTWEEAVAEINADKFPEIDELYGRWFDEELRMRKFLGEMPEDRLMDYFSYQRTNGDRLQDTYADIITQLVLHGMQHRSEAAVILTELGHSPGNLDYTLYLRPD